MAFLILILAIGLAVVLIRQVNQYERGVMLTLGRFSGIKEPGWRIVIPVFQHMEKIDLRVRAVDVPDQKVITRDNVSASINAVVYYRVADAAKAYLAVQDFAFAISQLAQTTMRNIVGSAELDEVLAERDRLSNSIREIIDAESDKWGIKVDNVELKDLFLPDEMERTIAKQAEAEREKRSVIIKAEGEKTAAKNMAEAAEILSSQTGALHLRSLQTLNDLSSDQSNTVIFAVPLEVLRAFERLGSEETANLVTKVVNRSTQSHEQ